MLKPDDIFDFMDEEDPNAQGYSVVKILAKMGSPGVEFFDAYFWRAIFTEKIKKQTLCEYYTLFLPDLKNTCLICEFAQTWFSIHTLSLVIIS